MEARATYDSTHTACDRHNCHIRTYGGRKRGSQIHRRTDSKVFNTDIRWLADKGVANGSNHQTNAEFWLPLSEGPVTRGQMAAFMHRLANKVVEVKTAITVDHAATADISTCADVSDSADKLDGAAPQTHISFISGDQRQFPSCLSFAAHTSSEVIELVVEIPADGYLQLSRALNTPAVPAASDFAVMCLTVDGDPGNFAGCKTIEDPGVPTGTHVVVGSAQAGAMDGANSSAALSSATVI